MEIWESFSEVINAVAGAAVPVDLRNRFTETARTVVSGADAVVFSFSALAELRAAARAVKNTPTVLELADALTARTAGSKNTPAALSVSELLTSITEAASQTTEHTAGAVDLHGALFMIKIFDKTRRRVAIAENAHNISEQQRINAVWYLYFSLPYKDIKTNIADRFTMSDTTAGNCIESCLKRWKQTRPGA